VFKRTEKTSFMPNSVVFPGGAIDDTDENSNWCSLFDKSGLSAEKLKNLEIQGVRPPIFYGNNSDALSR
jgi:nucleoside diphosphate-linked moiety X motif 19, mitochondrial